MSFSYLPVFVLKTGSERYPFPCFLFVQSLADFVAVLLVDRLPSPVLVISICFGFYSVGFTLSSYVFCVSYLSDTCVIVKRSVVHFT